jgi:lipopolysaccharide assembly outer membrane protein LptD (OstA)
MSIRDWFARFSFFIILGCILALPVSGQTDAAEPAASAVPDEAAGADELTAGETAEGDEPAAEGEEGAEGGGEAAGEEAAFPEEEAVPVDPAMRIIEMDIKTSTLTELAAWCRSLGLSEGGAREDLAQRLRDHFALVSSGAVEGEEKRKIITIESARSTQYFTLEVVDEEYARLQGDVVVSLKDGDSIHRIKAWEILFNRTRNLITATGGVDYIKESGETIETFRGDSITVNLDNWSSIFLDGISERSLQNDGTAYRFAGTVISRSEEEVTVLNRASISNAKSEEAFWSLNASKIWLLPGSDFAIFNAILKVGEIPVLYVPFFYYPADEVIFHPVLGYRSREGNFIQTTTYILGRPKASSTSESSITKILGNSADMEKRREGIFLRSTGKKVQDPSNTTLKAIVDHYANLGTYLGTEMSLPGKGIFGATDLSTGMGITRTVTPLGEGSYTPFANYDGTSEWNRSQFISWDVPFRYRLKTSSSLSGKFGTLSWAFPYYSDPYVDRDFVNNRSEEMDWFNMVKEGAALEETSTASENLLGTYTWQINGSLKPSLPFLAPYVSDLSLSTITSTIDFRTRQSKAFPSTSYNPSRQFFFPDKFTLYSLTASISGTPLSLGGSKTNQATTKEEKTAEAEDPFKNIGILRSPWEKTGEDRKKTETEKLSPPVLNQRFDMPRARGGALFNIEYRIAPTTGSELQFRSSETNWPEYDTIDWGEVSSILTTLGGNASTSFNLNHADGGLYTNVFAFSGSGSWQDYTYINEEAEEYIDTVSGVPDPAKVSAARQRTHSQTYFTTSYTYTGTVKPLYRSAMWSNSSLQYKFDGLLAKSAFIGTGDDPEWEIKYGAWDKDNLNSHQFIANVSASVMDHVQSFVFTADLPPKDATISGNATFRAWITETNANIKILDPADEDRRKFEPLNATETLKFGSFGSLSQKMIFDPEIEEYTSLTTNLTTNLSRLELGLDLKLSADFTMSRSIPYKLNYKQSIDASKPDGWIQMGDEGLNPQELKLGYSQSFKKEKIWKERLTFSVNANSSLTLNLQRYTNSRLDFSLGFTLGIANFIDLSLSTSSNNTVIYRYFKDLPFFDIPGDLPSGEQDDFFIDLLNSFRFDDETKRRSSGFKLKSFNLSATHHLGDWKATLGVTLSPYLDTTGGGIPAYKFNNEISFVVQWIPISEIKSDLRYTKDEWVFK